jgi:two-component system, chemotaxis family, chemotaxis protein CheY
MLWAHAQHGRFFEQGDKGMKFLIADDAMVMRNITKNVLRENNFDDECFFEAGDGETALELAEKENIDLFLVDWNMPKLDGLEFVKRIRTMPQYALTPIIMITSEAAKYNVMEAIEAGTTSYVVKPLRGKVLWDKISKFIPDGAV